MYLSICYILFLSLVLCPRFLFFFFFNDTATTEIYTLSLHDALPICRHFCSSSGSGPSEPGTVGTPAFFIASDRKSTRLNSSHVRISYAVFCLKKKKKTQKHIKNSKNKKIRSTIVHVWSQRLVILCT